MRNERKPTFIQAAVPVSRGPRLKHFERFDDLAMTQFNRKGEVEEIYTPQNTLMRIHEVMHARHTNSVDAYPGIRKEVAEIVEDCRLHIHHWPWAMYETPEDIVDLVNAHVEEELKQKFDENPYADFAVPLRAAAVKRGIEGAMTRNAKGRGQYQEVKIFDKRPGPGSDEDKRKTMQFAHTILQLINTGKHQVAAHMMQTAFFGDEATSAEEMAQMIKDAKKDKEKERDEDGEEMEMEFEDGDDGDKPMEYYVSGIATMETVELPLTEPTMVTTAGFRHATSGSRINRPLLRRPVLPQRLFIKQAPIEPAGVILFDSSGSMRVETEVLLDCCRRAPTAAVAFYKGNDRDEGKLWIFAKDGMRAASIPPDAEHYPGGNSVDGPAMDWMMSHDGPRIFVTDRDFCGSSDSMVQKMRLIQLEASGEVIVYTSFKEFQKEYGGIDDDAV